MKRARLQNMTGVAVFTILLLATGSGVTTVGAGQDITRMVDPLRDISTFAFGPGEQMRFDVGWNGIAAANVAVSTAYEMRDGRPVFRYNAVGKTSRLVRLFYTSEDRIESVIDVGSLSPIRYQIERNERGRMFTTDMEYEDGVFRSHRTNPTGETNYVIDAEGNFDPFSVLYIARSLPLKVGSSYTLGVVDGKNRYKLTLVVEAREIVSVKAGRFDALRIRPEVENLDEPGTEGKGRIRKIRFWVTNDQYRVPVRLESDVTFGRIYGELTHFNRGRTLQVQR